MPAGSNPWKTNNAAQKSSSGSSCKKPQSQQQQQSKAESKLQAQNKFEEIQSRNIKIAKKITDNYESSSDEEEIDGAVIIEKLYQNYKGGNDQLLAKTSSFLENVLQSGSAICLICIGTVKRPDSIWSCKYCFCFFHLLCIKRWANDSIALLKNQANEQEQGYFNNLGEYVPKKLKIIKWCCPQCRRDFTPADRPTQYECFCGKEVNPTNQPWLVPHSCGETCGKNLQPECGHKCLLLCHPGPCPPCPQIIITSCKCNKSQTKPLRCFQKTWTCESKCSKMLACQKHKCNQVCHESGKCPPCSKTSVQKCICRSEEALRSCSQLIWQCKKVCNLKYSCGLHSCKKVCHSGPCGDCPLGLPRSCPCGKTSKIAPCNELIDTCGDTCQKPLSCGLHYCTQRCHKAECSLCLIITNKKCRCGLHEKELPCWKSFTCETKCKQMKECGKHSCNKKCCDGQCPPCDKVCGKVLSCKKHKCKSVCHDGPCYPCDLKSQINCRCGSTSISVPCGRERRARPTCMLPCRIPSKCHHQNRHRCHKNECPPCTQKCGLPNGSKGCVHICEARCHAAVKVPIRSAKSGTSIWDYNLEKFEIKSLPHPQCEKKVMVTCIGGHENAEWPCWNSKPSSCHRPCGRLMPCGNHKCPLPCHSVPDITDQKSQPGCGSCTEGCLIPRPSGCVHPCLRPCHLPPCHPCTVNIKSKCHCGLSFIYYKCTEYANGTPEEIDERINLLKTCGTRCIKNYTCGHRCSSICHSGPCPNSENCRKKMRIYCQCRILKADVSCEKFRSGFVLLPCDYSCMLKKEANEKLKLEQEENEKRLEEERNRAELEQFEKKFAKKKYKERKIITEEVKSNRNWKLILILGATAVAIITAVAVALHDGGNTRI